MIAQLMAQRLLVLNPDVNGAHIFRQAIRLCASPKATIEQIAGMQATIAKGTVTLTKRQLEEAAGTEWALSAEIADLCQQALTIRRAALRANEPVVRYNIEARGRLVGA